MKSSNFLVWSIVIYLRVNLYSNNKYNLTGILSMILLVKYHSNKLSRELIKEPSSLRYDNKLVALRPGTHTYKQTHTHTHTHTHTQTHTNFSVGDLWRWCCRENIKGWMPWFQFWVIGTIWDALRVSYHVHNLKNVKNTRMKEC